MQEESVFAIGLLLLLLGASLMAAEAHVPSFGALGAGGVAAFAVGIVLLLSAAGSAVIVAVFAGIAVALCGGVLVLLLARKALATRRLRTSNSLIGRVGVARAADTVFVDGALWHARQLGLDDETPLVRGDPIVVEHVNGLTLTVRAAEEWEVLP
ncbi:MAG TPA: NfeD family protein [Solirubrobacter sp.]|nr:NfeD family protein [Solirubrobacter sp.]